MRLRPGVIVRYNRFQRAAYARRQEETERRALEAQADREKASRWAIAEGPLPENVWADGEHITAFGLNSDGCTTSHVLKLPGQGFYLQVASFPGWQFYVCVPVE